MASCKELSHGQRMSRDEFHQAYEHAPPHYKAELLGNTVFEPSALGVEHGESHVLLTLVLGSYSLATPGTAVTDNATVLLSDVDEVQPDLALRCVSPRKGNSCVSPQKFIQGGPELVAEIANSSRDIDLTIKKERYRLGGVLEYIVVCIQPARFYWYDLPGQMELKATSGIIRSKVFPGLWIDRKAFLADDRHKTLAVVAQGIASAEHNEFITTL